jgi:hypothetical protein
VSKIKQGVVMKSLTVDELLTRMFRDTANRIGWNVYSKDKYFIATAKRVKPAKPGNLKKIN